MAIAFQLIDYLPSTKNGGDKIVLEVSLQEDLNQCLVKTHPSFDGNTILRLQQLIPEKALLEDAVGARPEGSLLARL